MRLNTLACALLHHVVAQLDSPWRPNFGCTQSSNVFSSALYIKLYTVSLELILASSKEFL